MTFPCSFQGGETQNINFYIGYPSPAAHPIGFQSKWLSAKGGSVPPNISSALERLKELSISYNIPFVDLCEYVIAKMS